MKFESTETLPKLFCTFTWESFKSKSKAFIYTAVLRQTDDNPSFVFIHFPTDIKLLEQYRRESLFTIDHNQKSKWTLRRSVLAEGDELARGHFESMIRAPQQERHS